MSVTNANVGQRFIRFHPLRGVLLTLDSASKPVRKSSAYPDPGLGAKGPGGRAAEGNLFCPAICPSAPPPSLKSSAAQELAGAPENAMKHGSRQLARLGVLLARVIRRYQRESSGKLPFPAVPEFEFAARERASDLFPRFKIRPERDRRRAPARQTRIPARRGMGASRRTHADIFVSPEPAEHPDGQADASHVSSHFPARPPALERRMISDWAGEQRGR